MKLSAEAQWIYGWTHYKAAGQTQARLDALTRDIEIKDKDKWVKCVAGSDMFFSASIKATNLPSKIAPAWEQASIRHTSSCPQKIHMLSPK